MEEFKKKNELLSLSSDVFHFRFSSLSTFVKHNLHAHKFAFPTKEAILPVAENLHRTSQQFYIFRGTRERIGDPM